MSQIITRFAPSPTGNLHLGSARTALINFIVSSQTNSSKFHLRIEDTDKIRSKDEYKENIIQSLKWLGLNWDSDIQIQSSRIKKHQEVVKNLLDKKHAYKCNCDEVKLKERRENIIKNKIINKKICTDCKDDAKIQKLVNNFAVRIKIPSDGKTKIADLVQGKIEVDNKEIDDFIIQRKDGSPTYMLSVVVDDNDLGVNMIIRGDDHLNNAFRQFYIYQYMDWKVPEYAHIPLIHGEDGSKLSKRHGAVNILELKNMGYLVKSLINNLILLGWSPEKKNNEINKIDEIIKNFNIKKLSKSSSIFSYKKLNFFNNFFLKQKQNLNNFYSFCENNEIIKKYYFKDKEKIENIFEVYKTKLNYYEELVDILDVYFENNNKINLKKKFDKVFEDNIVELSEKIFIIDNWQKHQIEEIISNFLKEKKIKFPIFGKPMRYILINSFDGPSISDILFILGKKNSQERIKQYIDSI